MKNIIKGIAVAAVLKMLFSRKKEKPSRAFWRSRQASPSSAH